MGVHGEFAGWLTPAQVARRAKRSWGWVDDQLRAGKLAFEWGPGDADGHPTRLIRVGDADAFIARYQSWLASKP